MWLVAEAIRALENETTLAGRPAHEGVIAGSGLLQVASDPHTRVGGCLRALLRAELVDDEGWAVLAELAERMGQHDLATRFRQACRHEEGLSRVAL
jgi:hypothetical protein